MHSPDIYRRLLLPVLVAGVFILLVQACTKDPAPPVPPVIFADTRNEILKGLQMTDLERELTFLGAIGKRKGDFRTTFQGKEGAVFWCDKIEPTSDPITSCQDPAGPPPDAIHVTQMVEFATWDERNAFLQALDPIDPPPN